MKESKDICLTKKDVDNSNNWSETSKLNHDKNTIFKSINIDKTDSSDSLKFIGKTHIFTGSGGSGKSSLLRTLYSGSPAGRAQSSCMSWVPESKEKRYFIHEVKQLNPQFYKKPKDMLIHILNNFVENVLQNFELNHGALKLSPQNGDNFNISLLSKILSRNSDSYQAGLSRNKLIDWLINKYEVLNLNDLFLWQQNNDGKFTVILNIEQQSFDQLAVHFVQDFDNLHRAAPFDHHFQLEDTILSGLQKSIFNEYSQTLIDEINQSIKSYCEEAGRDVFLACIKYRSNLISEEQLTAFHFYEKQREEKLKHSALSHPSFPSRHSSSPDMDLVFNFPSLDYPLNYQQLSDTEKAITWIALTKTLVLNNSSYESGGMLLFFDEPDKGVDLNAQGYIGQWLNEIGIESNVSVFIATHSPFLIERFVDANIYKLSYRREEKLLEIESHANNEEVTRILSGGKVRLDSDHDGLVSIITRDLNQQNSLIVEDNSSRKHLIAAWKRLYPKKKMTFKVYSIHKNISGNEGASIQRKFYELIKNKGLISGKVIFLFDFDSEYATFSKMIARKERLEDKDNFVRWRKDDEVRAIQLMLLPVPRHRSDYASYDLRSNSVLEIEHYYSDEVLQSQCMVKKVNSVGGGSYQEIHGDKKKKFSEFVSTNKFISDDKSDTAFELLFKKLKENFNN